MKITSLNPSTMLRFKHLSPFLMLLLIGAPAFAQNEDNSAFRPTEEIGLRLISLQDFNFIYKKELRSGAYRRVRLASANLSFTVVQGNGTISSIGASVAVGKERRTRIAEKLLFHHGLEPGIGFNVLSAMNNSNQVSIFPFVGYVFGFQLAVSDRFQLGLEVTPSVNVVYNSGFNGSVNTFQVNAGFNTGAVGLTGVYRFVRK